MAAPVGRIIAYVITTAGPEPVSERRHPLDRAHYLDKQLRPVAEPVLELLDFDAVLDRPVQLRPLLSVARGRFGGWPSSAPRDRYFMDIAKR